MLSDKKIVVVMPAYNAEFTIEKTIADIPFSIVDEVVLVDDSSNDNTLKVAQEAGIRHILKHDHNKGYGANQKTCFKKALDLKADIIIVLHPDYQYTPKLIPSMCMLITSGLYPVVFGSRILGKGAIRGGMPKYKYFLNRVLTLLLNIMLQQKLSEYHTGYRAYSSEVLNQINFMENSNDFVFDNQIIAQIFMQNFEIAEITCPTKYFRGASSINFARSVVYGWGCLVTGFTYRLHKMKLRKDKKFKTIA